MKNISLVLASISTAGVALFVILGLYFHSDCQSVSALIAGCTDPTVSWVLACVCGFFAFVFWLVYITEREGPPA